MGNARLGRKNRRDGLLLGRGGRLRHREDCRGRRNRSGKVCVGLNARQDAVDGICRLAIWMVGIAVAAPVADGGRVEAGSACSGQIAEGQSGQQQLQHKSARHDEADQRPPDQCPRLMSL
jgi:hypothetical protein